MTDFRGLRSWVNQHGRTVGVGVLAIAVLAIVWSRWSTSKPAITGPTHYFFVDEVTGDIVVEPVDAIPPLPSSDGKSTLVRGCFFTLGSDTQKQLAYLEKYTDAGRAEAVSHPAEGGFSHAPLEMLVRAPEVGSQWVRRDSPAGTTVTARLTEAANKPGFRFVTPTQ